jgi:DNA (cytosine-5)-methyltransferase 1
VQTRCGFTARVERRDKETVMRILNLYSGIGGNRKLWTDVEVTAVELNPDIAKIYQDFFPSDKVIVGDAHQYLLEHFKEFDFIWTSPPCPTHSRFNFLNNCKTENEESKVKYPDMTLYQEIILLKTWFRGKFCVENVISYYKPLIPPIESNSHYFWTNFYFSPYPNSKRGIRGEEHEFRLDRVGFNLTHYSLDKKFEKQIINNCVEPEIGLLILNESKKNIQSEMFI